MKYYKAMNKDFTCRGFKYEIGKTYELPKSQKLELCQNGFHFCDILNDCFNYYDKDDCVICEVEPIGEVIKDDCYNSFVTNKIKIIRQLSDEEIKRERFHIQEGVKRIGVDCFDFCKDLKEINIPDSVTSIGDYAFNLCTSLENITIPNSVTDINWGAFANCESLKSVIIPNDVTIVCNRTFEGCTSLESVIIPNSVTTIGSHAFFDCTNLQKIYVSKNFNLDILENCILDYDRHKDEFIYLLDKVEIVRI